MRQKNPLPKASRLAPATRRTIVAASCAALALAALSGIEGRAEGERASPGFSVIIDVGSAARLSVLINSTGSGFRDAAPPSYARDPGMSLRLELAPGMQHDFSYNTIDKELTR